MQLKSRSVFFNLVIRYFLLILSFGFLTYIAFYQIIHSIYITCTTNGLIKETSILKELVYTHLQDETNKLNKFVSKLGKELNIRITIVNHSGRVLSDSHKDSNQMENHKDRPELISAMRTGFGKSIRYSNTLKQNMLYVAYPIIHNTTTLALIRCSIPLQDINSIISMYRWKLSIFFIIMIVIGFILSFFVSKNFSRPIINLSKASNMIAKGNFDFMIFPTKHNNREIEILEHNFDNMRIQLKTMFFEIEKEKEELKSIISSVTELIAILDSSGKITSANKSFNNIFNKNRQQREYYWEVVKNPKLKKYIKKAKDKRKNITREIELNSKNFLCSVNYIEANNGYIIILNDLSELEELSNIKRDIIANVSHEINTPLTTIKGYVETILDENISDNIREYLLIAQKNINRLENIISALLKLSELETNTCQLNFENIKLNTLIKNIIPFFKQSLKKKHLSIEFEPTKTQIRTIKGDRNKLEEVFINLIDNAIKYSDHGTIKIKIITIKNKMQVSICDEGIGIPQKDIGRIFERFYVVDKSRTKKYGGSGLGLSIVKHILLLHNATIKVTSKKHKGSCFTIIFPQK